MTTAEATAIRQHANQHVEQLRDDARRLWPDRDDPMVQSELHTILEQIRRAETIAALHRMPGGGATEHPTITRRSVSHAHTAAKVAEPRGKARGGGVDSSTTSCPRFFMGISPPDVQIVGRGRAEGANPDRPEGMS
jgi:hypothetical protein